MKIARIIAAVALFLVLLIAPLASANDFTFTANGAATGVWRDTENWTDGLNGGIPQVGDTATIPANKICQVEAAQAEACDSLTVQNGGELEVNSSGGTLTVVDFTVDNGGMIEIKAFGKLDTGMFTIKTGGDVLIQNNGELESDDFEIESGGGLEVRQGGTLYLPAAATVILDGNIQFNGCSQALIQGVVRIDNDIVIQGEGSMTGGFHSGLCPALFQEGAVGASLRLENTSATERLELFNIGRIGVDVENNADIILNNVDSNVSILVGTTASGSGRWITTAGCLKFDPTSTLTGSATFILDGDPLGGRSIQQCVNDNDVCAWFLFDDRATTSCFNGTLEFTAGTFTAREDFEHFGTFELGGDEGQDLEMEVDGGKTVELGKTLTGCN